MMEILFRGKRVDNGEWAESTYPFGTMSSGAVVHDFDPATIGQYTGLTDKNGVKIFDGDFIQCVEDVYRISWYQEHNAFMAYSKSENEVCYIGSMGQLNVEVIGNIHDNPELLEEAEAALETREDE